MDQQMIEPTPELLDAILRQDLSAFIEKVFYTATGGQSYLPNWHIDAIAHVLRWCMEGKLKRLIITMPPRSLKSICVSVAFPAFLLGHNPRARSIVVSYSQDLALKHAHDWRTVMHSDWYRYLFSSTRINPKRDTQSEVETIARGFRLATSVGGTLTGRGADYLILDDMMKPDEVMSDTKRQSAIDWYRNTLYTRLDDKENGVVIVVQQRLHEGDIVGYLKEQEGWYHLDLPAIAEEEMIIPLGRDRQMVRNPEHILHPERESKAALDRAKETLGSYNFAAQYQQRPAPSGGGLVKWKWFQFYEEKPHKGRQDEIIQSWDTASKAEELNSYSVCTTWLVRDNQYYLLDVFRARLEYPDLHHKLIELNQLHCADRVLVEDKGSGTSLLQEFQNQRGIYCIEIKPEQDKVTRMATRTPAIESGKVFLPKEAPWLAEFQRELTLFPNTKHNDQVDSVSQFLGYMTTRARDTIRAVDIAGF